METAVIIVFILLMLAEIINSVRAKAKSYQLRETLENIGIGFVSLFFDYGFSLLSYPFLLFLFDNYKIVQWQHGSLYYVILFVALDFIEYWFHRISHHVPLMWAAHKVHHQSRFFNLSVGLRTSFLIPFFNSVFYCVLPLCGFHPADVLLFIFIQGAYQLFVHTKAIKKMGVLDKLFVTPSVHRVHHGTNPNYLDTNFGKVLLVWDLIFKTWEPETEEVIYGATDAEKETGILKAQLIPIQKWWRNYFRKQRMR